jgi:hypothetical protein
MTRERFEAMSFDELMEWAYENLDDVTDEETLKQFAMCKLEDDDFGMALHIINAIYDNPYSPEWYRYDYCMGRLQTPSPIADKEDIEDLIFFEDEEDE